MSDQLFSIKSGFYDAINNDRTYNAEDMNKPYSRLVSDGVFANPNGTPSNDFKVEPNSGMSIKVGIGQGIVAHKWIQNDTPIVITVPTNTGLTTRIDSVILQVDNREAARAGSVVYRVGTSSPPALDSATTEYRLANISIAAGTSTITAAMITDLRGSEECPWVAALIEQPDLSQMWQNFFDAYQQALDHFTSDTTSSQAEIQQAWNDFFGQLTDELTMTMNLATLKNTYTATGAVTTIPIGITGYDSTTDILLVFINGLLASPSMYTESGSNVILAHSIGSGNKIDFLVLKSVVSADVSSTISLLQQMSDALTAFMSDSGWTSLSFDSGVVEDRPCKIRNIGGRVYLTGSIHGADLSSQITSVPFVPEYSHRFTTLCGDGMLTIEITTAGAVNIVRQSGSFTSSDSFDLDTCYLEMTAPTEVIVPDIPNADVEEF